MTTKIKRPTTDQMNSIRRAMQHARLLSCSKFTHEDTRSEAILDHDNLHEVYVMCLNIKDGVTLFEG